MATAIREVKEETGIDIENLRFGAMTNDIFEDDSKHYVSIWMVGDWKVGVPSIVEPDKYIDQGWFDFESLPQPLFQPWTELLAGRFMSSLRQELEASKKN